MTNEQKSRIEQALNETRAALAKELAYLVHLQKAGMIAFYRRHIEKLEWALSL